MAFTTSVDSTTIKFSPADRSLMAHDDETIDAAGRQAAYIVDEWTEDPAIMQTQALCYVGLQLERIADALEDAGE